LNNYIILGYHQEQFPLLSHLVRVVFSVQAASSNSERIFSEGGQVLTPKRNRMSPEKLEDLLIINAEHHIIERDGKVEKVINLCYCFSYFVTFVCLVLFTNKCICLKFGDAQYFIWLLHWNFSVFHPIVFGIAYKYLGIA
jgi:hypothetical protein